MSDERETQTIDVRSEIQDLERWRRRLALTVPAEAAGRVRERHVRELARRARLKGFRPGKAPARLVEKHYAQEIEEEVLKDLIREGYEAGVHRHGLEPISPPRVQGIHWTSDGALAFTAEVDVKPEIELARTTGFRVEVKRHAVGGEDVERVLDRLREERADWIPTERPAGDGDLVVFDSVPLDAGGAPRESERVENHKVVLGREALLPDFETGLQGVTPGLEKTIRVGFPEDHPNEGLRGTVREFRIAVSEVRERKLPDLDAAFAREIGQFDSVDEARAKIRSNLEEEVELQARREAEEALIDEIIAANEIDLPESMIDRYLANMMSDRDGPLGGRIPPEREAELARVLRPGAERALRRFYILEHVAEREGLEATAEDAADEDVRFHLTMERVFAWLRERSEITTV
ncbi:MAG TPA: trigger factor [Gemmatimonadota bacterium]